MESYRQPWTVVNKWEKKEGELKTYEYTPYKYECCKIEKPECHWQSKIEKPEWSSVHHGEKTVCHGEKPEWGRNYYRCEKPKYGYESKIEKPEWSTYCRGEKPEWTNYEREEKHEYGIQGRVEKPEWKNYEREEKLEYGIHGRVEKPEWKNYEREEKPEWSTYYRSEKPEWSSWYGQEEKLKKLGERSYGLEKVYGDWEKICDRLESVNFGIEKQGLKYKQTWNDKECCCDEETVKEIKELIRIFIGAEQSYIQLGFLLMDEKFTLVNTSEYFRLCGLRMKWLANGLMCRSARLFNVYEWINNTHFENWFKIPTKEELSTNDYTVIIKNFFKIVLDAETRIAKHMNVLGEKMVKVDWMNTECKFDGFKWFLNFVLPYQAHFIREMTAQWRNIEMCDNGYIFDKCEMYPLVKKIEEFIHRIVKVNNEFPVVLPVKFITEKHLL